VPKEAAKKKTGISQSTTSLKPGDKVEWDTSQGTTKGVVKKKVSSLTKVQGHEVKASKNEPQFLVESEKTGKKAAHKAKALKKMKG
jgi:plastocyanin